MGKKIYQRHEIVPFEEDQTHEFKGHRRLVMEDIDFSKHSAATIPSKQNLSKYICGMLNSGKGGVVYLGILDDGSVEGLSLSRFQKHHVKLALLDMFDNFKPRVSREYFNVRFVEVMEDKSSLDRGHEEKDYNGDQDCEFEHVLRTTRYCWCDADAISSFNCGIIHPFYIVEIHIKTPSNMGDQLYSAEDGIAYYRRNATNVALEPNEQEELLEVRQKLLQIKEN